MNAMTRGLVFVGLVLTVVAASAPADTQWWDTASTAGIQGGAGNWPGSSYWATNSNPSALGPFAWVNNNDAVFITNATVTVNGVQANSITFGGGQVVTFLPGSGPLTNGAGGLSFAAANVTTVGCDVVAPANQRWWVQGNINPGVLFTGKVSGAALTVLSAITANKGIIFSNANNSFNGLTEYANVAFANFPGVDAYAGGTVLGTGTVTLGFTGGSLTNSAVVTVEGIGNNSTQIYDLNVASPAILNLNSTGSTNTLTAGGLYRIGKATLTIIPANGLGKQEIVTITNSAAYITNGICAPWAVNGTTKDFLNYGGGGLTNATSVASFSTASSTQYVKLGAATNLSGSVYAQALFSNGKNINLPAGATLTVGNGTYAGLCLNSSITNNGASGMLDFQTSEALVSTIGADTGVIGVQINGTNGLTKFGLGTLILSNAALYGGPISLQGGQLTLLPTSDATLSNGIVGVGNLVKDGPNAAIVSGAPVANSAVGTLTVNAGTLVLTNNAALLNMYGAAYIGNAKPNATALITAGAGWNNGGQTFNIGNGTGATGNTLRIDGLGVPGGATVTSAGAVYVGNNTGANNNSLTVTNGGMLFSSTAQDYIGYYSANNTAIIAGGGAGWNNGGQTIHIGNGTGATGNTLRIDGLGVPGGATVTNAGAINVGIGAGACYNSLIVTNGGRLFSGAGTVGSTSASNNTALVGLGGLWDLGNKQLCVGSGAGATNNVLRIDGGGVAGGALVTNVAQLYVGYNSSAAWGNTVIITNGGVLAQASAATLGNKIGVNSSSNTVIVTGTNSAWVCAPGNVGGIVLGGTSAGVNNFNTLRVENGGTVVANNTSVGGVAGCMGNSLLISSGGSFTNAGTFALGGAGYTGNWVTVTSGGSLLSVGAVTIDGMSNTMAFSSVGLLDDTTTITIGAGAGNLITNSGGIYQFASAPVTLTVPDPNRIFINGGTISFRGIANADVFCNQSTKMFDSTNKMAWVSGGANTFRLNNATNLAAGQDYTFSPGTATNFARLELINNSMYRGGAVTIGNGGSLMVSAGVSTIASNLTFMSGSSLEVTINGTNSYSQLIVQGTNLTLAGTLKINLGGLPPKLGATYQIISNSVPTALNGAFGNEPVVTTTYMTTNYSMTVKKDATGVALRYFGLPRGTAVFFR